MKRCALSWSSGKDAAYALLIIQQNNTCDIKTLFCTLDQSKKRVSMHGIREELLDLQAKALGLPLEKVYLPENISIDLYSEIMEKELMLIKHQGVNTMVYGDILLKDLREYREKEMESIAMSSIFPLWNMNTDQLAKSIIASGIKAKVVAVSAKFLDKSFVGREYDLQFLADLPLGVDPCGENGEFHTFVYDTPNFRFPVVHKMGEKVLRSYGDGSDKQNWDTSFWFCELLPK